MVRTKSSNHLPIGNQESVAPQPIFDPVPAENPQGSNQGFGCSTVSCRSQMFSSAVSKALSSVGCKRSAQHLSKFVQMPPPPTRPVSSPLFVSRITSPEAPEERLKAPSGAPLLPEFHFSSDPLMEQAPTPPGSMRRASLINVKRKSSVPPIPSEWLWGHKLNASSSYTLREEALNLGSMSLKARHSSQSMPDGVPASVTVDGEVIQDGQTGNGADTRHYPHGGIPTVKIYGVNGQLDTKAMVPLHSDHSPRVTLLDFPDGVWKNLASVVSYSCLSIISLDARNADII